MSLRNLRVAAAAIVWLMVAMLAPPLPAMTLSTNPLAPPAAGLILGFDADDEGSYLCSHGSATAVDVGQTFLAISPVTLNKVTLKVRAATDDTRGELVTLELGTFTDENDDEMNVVLRSETALLPQALLPGVTLYLTLDFEDVVLEAGRHYGFLLGFTGGGSVNDARLEVLHLGENAYAGGQAIALDGAVITSSMEDDLVFFLHGSAQVAGDVLLLHSGRFELEATWRDWNGNSGPGLPVALTPASGYFYFFDPSNIEVVIKVLDGCSEPFMHYWVFAAGMTNLEVTVTVRDTAAGEQQTYVNPLSRPFETILDVEAFATCDL